MKKIVLIFILGAFLQGNVFAKGVQIDQLHSYDDFFDWFQHQNINPETTAAFFDIDNTLIKESPTLLNHDLFGEQRDQAEEISKKLNLNFKKAYYYHKEIRKSKKSEIQYLLVEPSLISVIQNLQTLGVLTITCTASIIAKKDKRIDLLKNNNIDFSFQFKKDPYVGENLPFRTLAEDSNAENYYGQTSSAGIKKSAKIDQVVEDLNQIRSRKNLPLIDTVIFVDNTKKKVEEVALNLKNANVFGVYYTFVRDNTNLDDVANQFKIAMSDLNLLPAKSVNRPCMMPEGEVQSANVLLLKKNLDGKPVVLLGQNASNNNQIELPGGHCETKDADAYATAARESHEETGGYLNLSTEFLKSVPYVFADPDHGNRVIFIVRDDMLDRKDMNETIKNALKNPNLSKYYKEIGRYSEISVPDFLKIIKKGKGNKKIYLSKKYFIKTNTSKALSEHYEIVKQKLEEVLEMKF